MAQDLEGFKTLAASIVGAVHVAFPLDPQSRFARTTSPRHVDIAGAVSPANTDEVAALVRLAGSHGVALYPVSTGRNWGYGDALPAGDRQVILDLSRMNRIVEVDETLAYAVIEPGVTQGMLYEHMQKHRLKLWLDCTGAGPDAGIVGNILERGFGHTPYGDRYLTVSGLEVVLGTGEVIRTGFGRYDGTTVEPLYPYGTGPVLDGLFSQSSLGIVTRMGIWLMPEPEYFCAAIGFVAKPEALAPLVDRLRPLRLDGTLRSVVHIANDFRLLSGRMRYPYERTGGRTPLPDAIRQDLRRELGIPPWTFSAGFYGSRGEVKAQLRRLRQTIAGLGVKLVLIDDQKLEFGRKAAKALDVVGLGQALARRIDDGEAAIGLLKGVPTRHFLPGAYWRSGSKGWGSGLPTDPAADGAGLLWLAPVLPATGAHCQRFLAIAEPVLAAHGFDCLLTYSMVNARSLAAVMTIAFDRDDPAEAEAASVCYGALLDALVAVGYPPYRGHSQFMGSIVQGDDPFWQAVGVIKAALDPANVLAPGRYSPRGR